MKAIYLMRPAVHIYPISTNFTFARGGAPPLSIEISPGQEITHQSGHCEHLQYIFPEKSDNEQQRPQH